MKRLLSATLGAALLLLPLRLLLVWMVPAPQYRLGTYADYDPVVRACIAAYGGALAGVIAPRLLTTGRPGRPAIAASSFVGALSGILLAAITAGRTDLLGLVLVLGSGLGAVIAVGVTLAWQAIRNPNLP